MIAKQKKKKCSANNYLAAPGPLLTPADTHPTDNQPQSVRKKGRQEDAHATARGRLPGDAHRQPRGSPPDDQCRSPSEARTVNYAQARGRGPEPVQDRRAAPRGRRRAAPGSRPSCRQPRRRNSTTRPPPTTTGWREDRCPVVSKRPLHRAMQQDATTHQHLPGPDLAAHCPSPPAAVSHARHTEKTQIPITEQNFCR